MTYSLKLLNRALRALNEDPIDEIDPDDLDSQPTRVIKLLDDYDGAIKRTLKTIGRGNFVSHIVLSPESIDGDWKFPYRYFLPADGLCFIDPPEGADLELAVERVGIADEEVLRASVTGDLQISYVRRIDPDLLSAEVFEACGLALAAACAWAITASRDHADRIEAKADKVLAAARGSAPTSTSDTPRRRTRMDYVRRVW